ncbi:DUF167 domain-containing protein [Pajaroellobacter abortibovis]|uniref:UPF0235 protein BCY86_00260 n=1 Tax=Pajaroellobacter abortibovis TaxID=1882918 RepID=A0A1L6MUV0_9BACT|nr:DUF167 domain-containing protein [Pajaroellobacter abortibovis]APR99279.1 hypothetical protein BCY86_00260 [Pajaroellobacter abortibovis]
MSAFIQVLVVPNAKQTRVLGMYGDALKVVLHAKPIEGEANRVLLEILSDYYRVPKSRVEIVKGLRSRKKWIRIKER